MLYKKPRIKTLQNSHRVNSQTWVARRLLLDVVTSAERRLLIVENINDLDGVDEVSVSANAVLHLEYDVCRVDLDAIGRMLKQQSATFTDTWCNRIKLFWYRFFDSNIKANFHHIPSCCNKRPPGR